MNLEVARTALAELRAAAKWYEAQREGLGDAFLDAIDRTVTAIVARPRAFARFVIFALRDAEMIRVLARGTGDEDGHRDSLHALHGA